MKKKLLALLSLLSVMVIGAGATACGGNDSGTTSGAGTSSEAPSGGGTSEESSDVTSEEATPSIALSNASLELDVFASATLTATLQNSTEAIQWTSSDESVAKVVDGVVTAIKRVLLLLPQRQAR